MARPGPGAAADLAAPGAAGAAAHPDPPGRWATAAAFGPYRLVAPAPRPGPTRAFVAELPGPLGVRRLELAVLPGSLGRDPRLRARLGTLWPLSTRLAHPHLVRTHETGRLGDLCYAAQEPAGAVDLAAVLADGEPIAAPEVALLGVALADALHHVHRRLRRPHGHVTPAQVRLDAAGRPRLDGLGLAPPILGEDRAFADPDWAAPEVRYGDEGGPAADLFALGAVLHACLSGLPPAAFDEGPEGRDFEALVDVPHSLRVALADTLAVDPRERAGSAEGLAERLRRWLRTAAPDAELSASWARRVAAVDPPRRRDDPPPPPAPGPHRVLSRSRDLEDFLAGALGPDSFGPLDAPLTSGPPSPLPPVPGPPRVPTEAGAVRQRAVPAPPPPEDRRPVWRRRVAWVVTAAAVTAAAAVRAGCGG